MIIYFIIFILSLSGTIVIALRHKEKILQFRFAVFMEEASEKISQWWYEEMHAQFLKMLEKYLRKSRILVLKIESFLFRKARAVRDISERNGNNSDKEETF